ncbi:MAG: hypothetical protein SPK75_06895 [Victivallales bacterium]|nr:hypothetical protein [Victivallales bacterium]
MNNAKFTPGPWKVSGKGPYHVENTHGDNITDPLPMSDYSLRQQQINAQLIATAPEMYDMLNTMLANWGDYNDEDFNAIVKLLEKAKGEKTNLERLNEMDELDRIEFLKINYCPPTKLGASCMDNGCCSTCWHTWLSTCSDQNLIGLNRQGAEGSEKEKKEKELKFKRMERAKTNKKTEKERE